MSELLIGNQLNQNFVAQSPETTYAAAAREEALHTLLGTDYDFARESGLIDLFYYEPETGRDGLMHTLTGEVIHGENGARVTAGFHHEPSAQMLWETSYESSTGQLPTTYVDRTHLATANSEARKDYREKPFEPYQAKVVIDGVKKLGLSRPDAEGKRTLKDAKNSMYPKEYDALAVMQTVRSAYESRDPSQDILSGTDWGVQVITNISSAVLLDGKTRMKVKLVIDQKTGKVITASPVTSRGYMNLTPADVNTHLGLD